ncbi:MAG: ABC transporter ATP-binding protein [Planctomycetota bacterium]
MAGLIARSLSKQYPTRSGSLSILRDCSLTLEPGHNAAIVGPSGSGKSTLLNILGTLETPDAGSVSIGGDDPFALSETDLSDFRNRRIGFVFQEHHLLPQCSALENVLIPTLANSSGPDLEGRARDLLKRAGLSHRLDHLPGELSGGERQRVAVARALIHRPSLLLADEPTGNLDRTSATDIADLLLGLHREENACLIVVTHSADLARRLERRYEINEGRLITAA